MLIASICFIFLIVVLSNVIKQDKDKTNKRQPHATSGLDKPEVDSGRNGSTIFQMKEQIGTTNLSVKMTLNENPFDIEIPYVALSTAGDDHVCKMCKQFEGKLFRAKEAPRPPFHPLCACAYQYFEKCGRRKIWNPSDFVLPADCTPAFCANAAAIAQEKDIRLRIRLCEEGLAMLKDFLAPYRSAGWSPPEELPCVYRSIDDYMAVGDWKNAEQSVQICIDAGAFTMEEGKGQLNKVQLISEASSAALQYLTENPGTLQRNIYRKLCPPCDREALKWFLAHSLQIRKEKEEKTNKLFVAEEDETHGKERQSGGGATA